MATANTETAAPTKGAKTAKPAANAKPATEKAEPKALATVKSGALSLDVGVKVLELFDKAQTDEAKAHALADAAKSGRYKGISMMTMAIVKAAKADETINLADAFQNGPKYNYLADQIRLAVGIFERVTTKNDKGKEREILQPSKEASKFITLSAKDMTIKKGADGKDVRELHDSGKRKESNRTNLMHLIKDSAQAAAAIVDNDLKAEIVDTKGGTLRLSGPKIKEHFGTDAVTLDEHKTEGMKEKPSFKEVRRIAAAAQNLEIGKSTNERAAKPAGTAAEAFASVVRSFIKAVNGVKTPTEDDVKLLNSAKSAIELKLKAAKTEKEE